MGYLKTAWELLTNPPTEVVNATVDLGSNVLNCVTVAVVTYAQALVDVITKAV